MESHYVVITESSWLRSPGHGEVHGTKSESTLCEKAVSDVGEAVRRFAAEYGQATVADGRIVSGPQLLKPVDGGWEQPTEDEVSRWQKGQLPLCGVMRRMAVCRLVPLGDGELRGVAEGAGGEKPAQTVNN